MQITYSMLTDKGGRRNNEDSVGTYELDNEYCFVLADGLGGHGRGEVASRLVVETTGEVFKKEGLSEYFMREAFEMSQETLMDKQMREDAYDELKTTLSIIAIGKESIAYGHIGDSRIYMFQGKKLVSQTKDHSVPQMLVTIGEITEKEIRYHPDRSKLLYVMGAEWERPKYEIVENIDVTGGLSFLVCSDGFWEHIDEKQMLNCLKKAGDVEEWISSMQKIVIDTGSSLDKNMDNYSAIGIWIRD